MPRTVLMQFGDGNFHAIEVDADEEQEALEEAREWVRDNAWFEVADEDGQNTSAELKL